MIIGYTISLKHLFLSLNFTSYYFFYLPMLSLCKTFNCALSMNALHYFLSLSSSSVWAFIALIYTILSTSSRMLSKICHVSTLIMLNAHLPLHTLCSISFYNGCER